MYGCLLTLKFSCVAYQILCILTGCNSLSCSSTYYPNWHLAMQQRVSWYPYAFNGILIVNRILVTEEDIARAFAFIFNAKGIWPRLALNVIQIRLGQIQTISNFLCSEYQIQHLSNSRNWTCCTKSVNGVLPAKRGPVRKQALLLLSTCSHTLRSIFTKHLSFILQLNESMKWKLLFLIHKRILVS